MTISERGASTVFDRFNFTITDIINFSDPTPTNYTAQDFFTFYEIIFHVDQTQVNWPQTTQYMFLLGISVFLGDPTPTQNGTGSDDRMSRLEEFLATPIFLFNNAMYGGATPPLGKSVTLATRSYRVPTSKADLMVVGHRTLHDILLFRRGIYHPFVVFYRPRRSSSSSISEYFILPRDRYCFETRCGRA